MNSSDAARLVSDLVAIDSVNPSLVPGGAGETEIAAYVSSFLRQLGLDVEERDVARERPNVVAVLKGTGGGRAVLLNAHTDTVGFAGMDDPLTPALEGDRIFGRGAYDMKGGLAAILLAVEELSAGENLRGDVIVTAVADEEYSSLGTELALQSVTADAAIVTEPTGLDVCIAHKGFAWIEIETTGRASHGSRPDLGRDAIGMMGEVIVELNRINDTLRQGQVHPLLGTASLHASLVRGGQELSSYPASCLLHVERRTLPGESQSTVGHEIAEALRLAGTRIDAFDAQADVFFWRDAFSVSEDSFVVRDLREAATGVLGRTPAVVGQTPWMDAALIQAAGIPTAVFGPGGDGAHAVSEWVSLSDVVACAQTLAAFVRSVCA